MIVFNKLKYRNFLASGNMYTEYNINASKNMLIIGKNGAGKSTILDALCFALFGKAYRNINKPQLVNSINNKDCVVTLDFTIGNKKYSVTRGLKPSLFTITVNGASLDQNASVKDFQHALESDILKMNYKSFCSVVILGSRYASFMSLTPADRRKVVEDILDIEVFSSMNTLLKDRVSSLKEEIRDNKTQMQLVAEKRELQQSNIDSSNKEREEEITKKQQKIERLILEKGLDTKALVDDREEQENITNKIIVKKAPLEAKQKQVNEIFRDLNKTKTKTAKELKFFNDHHSCPTCEQDIEEAFRDSMITTKSGKVDEIETAIDTLMEKIRGIDTEMEEITQLEEWAARGEKSIANRVMKIRNKSELIESLESEIAELQNRQNNMVGSDRTKVMEELESELAILEGSRGELTGQKKTQDVALTLLKDTGIKAKIIENYLPVINEQINQHLQDLDFFVKFELSDTFSETIKSRHLDDFSYTSFSEGEKARIDLALLFTWRKIAALKNSVNTNLLILDKVFDGSLDAIGSDEVMAKLLFRQPEGTNTYIISHKQDMVDKFENVIQFDKVKGFSRMV